MELYHHGVPHQQWGVRHGPPYPIDRTKNDITIKSGSKFSRYTLRDEHAEKGHAYVNYIKDDVKRYGGFFAAGLRAKSGGKQVYRADYISTKDLKAPSKQKRINTFLDMYKANPAKVGKELGDYHKSDWHHPTPRSKRHYEKVYSKLKPEEMVERGYGTFVRALGSNQRLRSEYFKRLSKQGYDFVTDDLDGGTFAREPAILFSRANVSYAGQTAISKRDIRNTWRDNPRHLKKEGSNG